MPSPGRPIGCGWILAGYLRKPRPIPRPHLSEAQVPIYVATAQGNHLHPPRVSGDPAHRPVSGFAGHSGRLTSFRSFLHTKKYHFPRRAGLPKHPCNTHHRIRPDVYRMRRGSGPFDGISAGGRTKFGYSFTTDNACGACYYWLVGSWLARVAVSPLVRSAPEVSRSVLHPTIAAPVTRV